MTISDEILTALSEFEPDEYQTTIKWLEDKSTGRPDDDVILTILVNGSIVCSELEDIKQQVDRYCGCFKDASEFAEQIIDDLENPSDFLKYYIDFWRLGFEVLRTDYIGHQSDETGMLYVFRK